MNLEQFDYLQDGQSVRVNHDCANDKSASVYRNGAELSAYCYRCGFIGKLEVYESHEQRLARLTQQRDADAFLRRSNPKIPLPITEVSKAPPHALQWLLKGGLDVYRADELGIYYHQPTRRVILPVIQGGEVVYYQARGFEPHAAKYLNPRVDKASFIASHGEGDFVILTEDLLSMWAVSSVGKAVSLMGTQMHEHVLAYLVRRGQPVFVWLDPDKAGQEGMAGIERTLNLFGVHTLCVHSDKDPKLYSRRQIIEWLRQTVASSVEAAGDDSPFAAVYPTPKPRQIYEYVVK